MKLVGWSPENNPENTDPKSSLYLAIKRTLAETEIAGGFSLQLLQATILVTLYEVGHAIYPAAYMSAGTCARYALAQGIDAYMTVDLNTTVTTLLDLEEKRRAWWAVFILDRALTVHDPAPDALLPADDAVFDQGTVTLDHLYIVSSPIEPNMGSFAKMCQSSLLLGRVFQHICNLTAERAMHQNEGIQLSNNLQASLKVLERENQISSATAICSSALMTLHDPNSARIDAIHLEFVRGMLKPMVEEPPQSVADFLAANLDYQAHPSPLLCHWIYQAATVVSRLSPYIGDDIGTIENLMARLEHLNRRWLVAGAYLHILTGR
ncbi:MAG: hypothetical protein Q9216_000063 [Gyalolechia sp. 2 TL-2023]